MKNSLTFERLHEVLRYDSEKGTFARKEKPNVVAGCLDRSKGYVKVSVDGVVYMAHRLAWLYVYGKWPQDELDHINGQRDDNRITNLREASRAENAQNRKLHKNNQSGLEGVNLHKSSGTWRMSVSAKGIGRLVGYFRSQEEAFIAYQKGKEALLTFCPTVRSQPTQKG